MQVLGFDPSLTNFGWALLDGGALVDRGRFQTSSKTLFVDRYTDLRQRLRDLIKRTGARRVGVESPVFGDLYSEGMYGLYLYTCEALKAERCDVVLFSPGQGKAHARHHLARPKGWKMMKPDMVEAATDHAGVSIANHNEADAYWIAVAASRFWMYLDGRLTSADLTATEQHQFLGDRTYRGIAEREDERFFRWSGG